VTCIKLYNKSCLNDSIYNDILRKLSIMYRMLILWCQNDDEKWRKSMAQIDQKYVTITIIIVLKFSWYLLISKKLHTLSIDMTKYKTFK